MATVTTYHPGGLIAGAPALNRAEEYDSAAGTYTRWSTAGTIDTQRALTAPEAADLAARDAAAAADLNGTTLRQQAAAALAANRTYVAVPSPTATQTTAQVKALSRQMNGLIRLALGQLDGTD